MPLYNLRDDEDPSAYDGRDQGGITGGAPPTYVPPQNSGGYTTPGKPVETATPTPTPTGSVPPIWQGYGNGTPLPWAKGASRPTGAPAGYRWDDSLATFVPGEEPAASGGGGDLRSQIENYYKSRGVTPLPTSIDYWLGKKGELDARGQQINNPNYFWERLAAADEFGGGGGPRTDYNSNSVFDDPATAAWLKLLNDRVNALNTPYHNPQLDQLNGYLQQYFEKLQGPAYTPQQMDLLQTQSLDPLSRERDAARQRVLENAARRGLDPQSGIVQKQISDLENQFEQIRTKTQAGFASKAVDLDRINAQQAAGVAQALANIEQTQFANNEARAGDALNLAFQVPQLARQRLLDANSVLGQTQLNPTSLLQLSQQNDQFGSQQQQQFWLALAQLAPQLLSLFGVGR